MDDEHNKFLCRVAKTFYNGNRPSLDSVSLPLTELAAELYNEVKKENSLDRLNIREIAEINQNACVSTCSLVLAIMYLEKLRTSNFEYVEKVAPSELFLVSLLVASKYLHDTGEEDSISNYDWAECAGISLKRINEMEKDFLNAIQWNIHVTDQMFWSRLRNMEKIVANKEGKRRGWYSYTELNILLTTCELDALKELIKQLIFCVTCYTTSLASFIATGLLVLKAKHIFLNCLLCTFINQNSMIISNEGLSPVMAEKIVCDTINGTKFPYEYFINQMASKPEECSYDRNLYNKSRPPNYVNLSHTVNQRKIKVSSFEWIFQPLNNRPNIIGKNL